MDESTKTSIDAAASDIDAGGDVKFIGGSEYNITGHVFNIDVAPPSYSAEVKPLQISLEKNRITLRDDLIGLEVLVRKGLKLNHGAIRAIIKDIIISSKTIEKLIPAIRLKGGEAKSLPFESDTVDRINNAIMKGQKKFKEKELVRLEKELPLAKEKLKKAEGFVFFRTKEEKIEQVGEATKKVETIERDIEWANKFLERCEKLLKYDEPKIPSAIPKYKTEPIPKKTPKPKDIPKKATTKSKLKGTLMKKKGK